VSAAPGVGAGPLLRGIRRSAAEREQLGHLFSVAESAILASGFTEESEPVEDVSHILT
jgi:hypothetical protein